MTIKVRVQNSLTSDAPWEVVLPEPMATIGRQANCAVILSDPEKHVSRIHATIEMRGGAYFLTVNSRINPVLLDGAVCEPGTAVELRDGASLSIHPFDLSLQVSPSVATASPFGALTPSAVAPPSPTFSAPPPVSPPAADDPFGWLDGFSGKPAAGASSDPFGLGQAAVQPVASTPQSDLFKRDAPPPSNGLAAGLVPGLGSIGRAGNGGVSLESGPATLDPMALLGGAPASSFAPMSAPSGGLSPGANSIDDFLGIGLGPAAARSGGPLVDMGEHRHSGSSNLDHVHDFNLPFQAPNALNGFTSWDAPATAPRSAQPAAPSAPATPITPSASSDALLKAFLEGLGASAITIPPGGEAEFFRRAGEIVHSTVQGLITLLLARAEVKKELRAGDRTMLAAHNNNPLKFMAGTEEAVRFLFDPAGLNAGAFLPPVKAVADACDELVAHEMGLVAGLRAAVAGSIKRFDPTLTEQVADKLGGLVLNKKAKLWDLHVEQYAKTQREMADNLDRLFEGDFLRAYSEQVWRMQQKS